MKISDTGIQGERDFPSTHWSLIQRLRDPEATGRDRDIERLVELYWKPVYCTIRFAWTKSNSDAKDLTQDFFATHLLDGRLVDRVAPARGTFRALLKTALDNFMRKQYRDAHRQKRGGDAPPIAFGDLPDLDEWLPDAEGLSPDQAFDAAWNHMVTARALELTERRLRDEGKIVCFDVLTRYDLEDARATMSYADFAKTVNLTPDQVRHGLAYARARLRDAMIEVVGQYVSGADELAHELRDLLGGQ